jgi:hypothetical protein
VIQTQQELLLFSAIPSDGKRTLFAQKQQQQLSKKEHEHNVAKLLIHSNRGFKNYKKGDL